MSMLNRLFGAPEEINGANRCPTYLYRWHLFKTRWFKVYLHHFVADDWSLDLHDHPKRFVSIGIRGGYMEYTPNPRWAGDRTADLQQLFMAPWARSFRAEHIHRLSMLHNSDGSLKGCWTLVIVFREVRKWGFWHLGKFIPWREYVQGDLATEMKACSDD